MMIAVNNKKTFTISKKENKIVSLGYSYIIPIEERTDKKISEEMKIISYKEDIRDEITVSIDSLSNPLSLAEIILKVCDELDNQKTKKI